MNERRYRPSIDIARDTIKHLLQQQENQEPGTRQLLHQQPPSCPSKFISQVSDDFICD